MENRITFLDQWIQNRTVGNACLHQLAMCAQMANVGGVSARKIIEQGYLVSAGNQGFGEVGADESGTPGDEVV